MVNCVRTSWIIMLQLAIVRCLTTRGFSPRQVAVGPRTFTWSSRTAASSSTNTHNGQERLCVRQWMSSSRSDTSDGGAEKKKDEDNTVQQTLSGDDLLAEYRNPNNVADQVFSAISKDGSIKVTACTVRNIINDLMIQHSMTKVPADALGRMIICSLLISNGMQEEQTVQLSLNANGPLRGVVAIASGLGEVRGYVGSPMLGDMHIREAIGKGMVHVVKNHPSWPNPYNGITAIEHGDIDRDIGIYLAESEQRSCALAAATSVTGILCKAGGGYLIEQLPGAEQDTLTKVEQNLATIVQRDGTDQLPTGLLLQGTSPVEMVEMILDGLELQPLQQMTPKLVCKCTSERLIRALRLLPSADIDELLEKEDQIEARCEFCGKVYRMGSEEIRTTLAEATGDPSKDSDFYESDEEKEEK